MNRFAHIYKVSDAKIIIRFVLFVLSFTKRKIYKMPRTLYPEGVKIQKKCNLLIDVTLFASKSEKISNGTGPIQKETDFIQKIF